MTISTHMLFADERNEAVYRIAGYDEGTGFLTLLREADRHHIVRVHLSDFYKHYTFYRHDFEYDACCEFRLPKK